MNKFTHRGGEYSGHDYLQLDESRSKDHNSTHRTRLSCLCIVLVIMLIWNIVLHVQTSRHSQKIAQLELKHSELSQRFMESPRASALHRVRRSVALSGARVLGDPGNDTTLVTHGMNAQDLESISQARNVISSILKRQKRTTSSQQKPPTKRKTSKKSRKSSQKKSSGHGAHFAAYVDEEKLNRQLAQGLEPTIGKHDSDGSFVPNDSVYRFWKPTTWSSSKLFAFSDDTGKVTVKRAGYYLVYGQIVFHGSSARKSYGIHINDEIKPFVESIAFDNIREHRSKRDISSLHLLNTNSTVTDHPREHRQKRSHYSSYGQCNTVAVAYLKQNDEVFLKSLRPNRPIITQPFLTFWGLARL